MKIRDLAFARSSDKGDHVDIGVFAYTAEGYATLRAVLTAERVRAWFAPLGVGAVERYEVPGILALKFVIRNALDGGAARSIRADNQGKTWSGALLRMDVEPAS
ncbi:MAG: hypothetical protein K6V97_03325 [Actinomycetia bacterium]|nr:hypothetical protein [Actinomycetes bacterium]